MAKVIGDADQRCFDMDCDDCPFHTMELGLCKEKFLATALYNAGYRKQSEGEWMVKNAFFAIYKCSICGEENSYKDGHAFLSDFCPNCGAKMKGGEE